MTTPTARQPLLDVAGLRVTYGVHRASLGDNPIKEFDLADEDFDQDDGQEQSQGPVCGPPAYAQAEVRASDVDLKSGSPELGRLVQWAAREADAIAHLAVHPQMRTPVTMLGYAATTDVRDVPMVVADGDRSSASRELVARSSPNVQLRTDPSAFSTIRASAWDGWRSHTAQPMLNRCGRGQRNCRIASS